MSLFPLDDLLSGLKSLSVKLNGSITKQGKWTWVNAVDVAPGATVSLFTYTGRGRHLYTDFYSNFYAMQFQFFADGVRVMDGKFDTMFRIGHRGATPSFTVIRYDTNKTLVDNDAFAALTNVVFEFKQSLEIKAVNTGGATGKAMCGVAYEVEV